MVLPQAKQQKQGKAKPGGCKREGKTKIFLSILQKDANGHAYGCANTTRVTSAPTFAEIFADCQSGASVNPAAKAHAICYNASST